MLLHLSPEELRQLEDNQKEFCSLAPVTFMATFKLSSILELIEEIKKSEDFTPDGDFTHNICITFVRQESDANELHFYWKNNSHIELSQSLPGKTCTQVIPVIAGCVSVLDEAFKTKSFKYIKANGKIPAVRPGGEGSGLIPPPPPGGKS
jgi:hypothetical protein